MSCQDGFVSLQFLASHIQAAVCELKTLAQPSQLLCQLTLRNIHGIPGILARNVDTTLYHIHLEEEDELVLREKPSGLIQKNICMDEFSESPVMALQKSISSWILHTPGLLFLGIQSGGFEFCPSLVHWTADQYKAKGQVIFSFFMNPFWVYL